MSTKRKSRGQSLVRQLAGTVEAIESPFKAIRLRENSENDDKSEESLSPTKLSSLSAPAAQAESNTTDSVTHVQSIASKDAVPTVINLSYEQSKLLKIFQSLELVLATLRARRQIANFMRIQDGMERLTQQPFTMEHLREIVGVHPDMFSLRWMKDAMKNDYSLCIAIQSLQHDATNNAAAMSRTEVYADKLQQFVPHEGDANVIPEKPSIAKRGDEKRAINPLQDIRSQKGTSLAGLRQNAAKREQLMKELNISQITCAVSQQEERLRTLPEIFDCIHSHFLIAKRTQQSVPKVVAAITQQQRIGKVSRAEAKERLRLLATLLPSALVILTADRDHSQEVLRLKLTIPYNVVRRNLLEKIEEQCNNSAAPPR